MTYENFLKIILKQQLLDRQIEEAYKLKIDLIDFLDGYHEIISTLIKEIYGEDGYEWYSWFCYESEYGHKGVEAWDKDKNPICFSFESLHEYLENSCKTGSVEPEVKEEKIVESLSLQELMDILISDVLETPHIYSKPEEKYLSILEHQGTVAGRELGKQVATAAQKIGVRPITRTVNTLKYQGPILTYPRSFLDNYFSTK